MSPSEHFVNSVAANVAYWSERTNRLDNEGVGPVDRERQNLYRAADFGLGLNKTRRATTDLILQCYALIDERGYSRDWIRLLERTLIVCPNDDLRLKGRLLGQLGTLYRRSRQLEKAITTHQEEEAIGLTLGDGERTAHGRLHLAYVHYRLRQYGRGMRYARSALDAFREIDPKSELTAATLSAAGLIATNIGDLGPAEDLLGEAVDIYKNLDMSIELGRVLINLGNVKENGGQFDEAIALYQESEKLLMDSGSGIEEMRLHMSLGTLYYHQEKYKEAEKSFRRADSQYVRQWATSYQAAQIKMNLANVLLAQGRLAESEAYWRECIPEWREAKAHLMLANSLGGLAETVGAQGDQDQAVTLFDEALTIIAQFPDDAWARKLEVLFFKERAEAALKNEESGHPNVADDRSAER